MSVIEEDWSYDSHVTTLDVPHTTTLEVPPNDPRIAPPPPDQNVWTIFARVELEGRAFDVEVRSLTHRVAPPSNLNLSTTSADRIPSETVTITGMVVSDSPSNPALNGQVSVYYAGYTDFMQVVSVNMTMTSDRYGRAISIEAALVSRRADPVAIPAIGAVAGGSLTMAEMALSGQNSRSEYYGDDKLDSRSPDEPTLRQAWVD